ncbi:PhzF family phenazine biosynthesis protein [Methanoregula sp.]|jgi:predicted PhzF superfamily epimerase YddE/YHI9|uniref:PhzF family phenazine biosynthesis protein n=1 Tax=Methanoregula sp. TaxID=2052170 RepID=UPI0025D5C349|nr:PhzF family phenazine biosynthesis protein [Methanoregula sp.]
MGHELHVVDAFTGHPFRGNPAGVCILDEPADPSWMQQVAAELNHSETAFLHPGSGSWNLRWFTPAQEVELCGHATLAAAFVLWETGREQPGSPVSFETLSGTLTARRDGEWIYLDFPAEPAGETEPVPGLDRALGATPVFVGRNRFDLLVELPAAADVCDCEPDMAALAAVPARGIIVTAPSDLPAFDFVSRFFAPALGVPEDPVTGSAHCCLGPYWGEKLHKTELFGFQCSLRGGTVRVTLNGDRVILGGHAVRVFSGQLLV